jgi:hypothetical protein
MMRADGWTSWLIGLAFGVAAGGLVLLGGTPILFLSLAMLALAFAANRSLAFVSGAFAGVGGTWLALTIRAQLACYAFNAAPNQGCTGHGVGPFIGLSLGILAVGAVLGIGAWRRRAGPTRSQSGS